MRIATVLCAALLCASTAHAAVLSETQGWNFSGFGDYDQDEPIFNAALGKLDSVQVAVSGHMSWSESALITQPIGHETIMREHNRFGANWIDSLGNIHAHALALPTEYFFDTTQFATPKGGVGVYGTFGQNPALFAGGAPVELILFGSGSVNPADCTAPCRFQFLGGDELLLARGTVTTAFTYTPPDPVPEPAGALLLLPAIGALLWQKRVCQELR